MVRRDYFAWPRMRHGGPLALPLREPRQGRKREERVALAATSKAPGHAATTNRSASS